MKSSKTYPKREEFQWRPAPLLCKRFDLPDPFMGKVNKWFLASPSWNVILSLYSLNTGDLRIIFLKPIMTCSGKHMFCETLNNHDPSHIKCNFPQMC